MQYEVTITFDIPCTRDGVLAVNPSEVLSYIRDEINCGRGNRHPDDGIQDVKFRCSRVRKVIPQPGEGRRIDQEAAVLAAAVSASPLWEDYKQLRAENEALRRERDELVKSYARDRELFARQEERHRRSLAGRYVPRLVEALKKAIAEIRETGEYMQTIARAEEGHNAAYQRSGAEVMTIEACEKLLAEIEASHE